MPTIGNSAKPSSSWHAFSSSSNPNQESELLTMPETGELLTLGAWVGGWNGSCRIVLAVWAADGTMLGRSDQVTVANQGAGGPSGGNVEQVIADLQTPVRLSSGDTFFVGFARHTSDGHQVSASGTGPEHYEGRSGGSAGVWQTADLGAVGGIQNEPRRLGMWVQNYDPVAGAKVRVSGVWVDADDVQVRASGAWVSADAVQIRSAGSWVDAD